ncbi:hypothetical protein T492DRAFT_847061 [Pavlovales sp. CCMP2436]|nr:hypothetical protein T492DRAFT_847061 [Pavlovales sp. CCMP2436]
MAALRPCTADDLDALLSPACAASTLAPLACGALVLVLSAVRLGQLLAPRVGLLRTPERTSQGRVLVFVLVLGAAGGSAWVGWSAAGALERVVSAVAAGGWAFGALVALSSLHAAATGGGWHVGGSALAGAAAAAPVALAMLRVPWAEPWTEPDATSEQVAAALCQLGAAAAMLLCALLEASGVLAANESPAGLMEPLLAHTADDGTFHDEAPVSAGMRLCPEASAGPLSRIMFGWMSPLLAIGALRPIQPSDLWELDLPDRTEALIARWKLAPKNSGAVRGLREVVGARFLAGGVFRLLSDASQLGTPVLLNLLLEYLQQGDALAAPDEEKESEKGTLAYGIGLALLLFTSQLAQSLFDNQCAPPPLS